MTFALKDKGFPYSIASKLKIKHNFTKQLIYPARLGMSSYKNEKKKKRKKKKKSYKNELLNQVTDYYIANQVTSFENVFSSVIFWS